MRTTAQILSCMALLFIAGCDCERIEKPITHSEGFSMTLFNPTDFTHRRDSVCVQAILDPAGSKVTDKIFVDVNVPSWFAEPIVILNGQRAKVSRSKHQNIGHDAYFACFLNSRMKNVKVEVSAKQYRGMNKVEFDSPLTWGYLRITLAENYVESRPFIPPDCLDLK